MVSFSLKPRSLVFVSFSLFLLSVVCASPDSLFLQNQEPKDKDLENNLSSKKPLDFGDLTKVIDGSKKVANRWSKKLANLLKNKGNEKSKKIKTKKNEKDAFTVLTHDDFPRYQIRYKPTKKLCDPDVKQITGYLDVDSTKHFFFWFFESRSSPESDPLILWLNGGPGCSSLTGLFMELGPCRATESGSGTEYNEYSWNNNANIIFLDQPVNVGFSYSESGETTNTLDAAKDVYAFLQLFLLEFDKYQGLEFHVTGESYAGHYIPAIANEIINGNYELPEPNDPEYPDDPLPEDPPEGLVYINFKSVAIGNGLTDPLIQYKYYSVYNVMAADTKYGPILDARTISGMKAKYDTCASLINSCYNYQNSFACVPGSFYCNNALISPFQTTGLNIYDVRKKCDPNNSLCYSILGGIEKFLNRAEVQAEIGVDKEYVGCNTQINMRFLLAGDWMRPYHQLVPGILAEGIKILIYAGDADYICNHFGNKAWALEIDWEGKEGFNNAEDEEWVSEITGKPAGNFRTFGGLTYLQVYEAGHMVPYDQPEASSEFINNWIGVSDLKKKNKN
ncbi:hypothetical protein HK096_006326 [Nowakowskiella sp. JEL0078]|nr:hypothetical protein HK096_006326 [Nowakowskiella sp. JEL0078]